jgi:hypothetical protein
MTPKSVLRGHLADEGPKFRRNWAAAWPPWPARTPAPICSPTLAVPPQYRFGSYDEERGSPATETPTRPNPETPVNKALDLWPPRVSYVFRISRPWLAAGPAVVAGGKDCLRSAAQLVGPPPQSPTANTRITILRPSRTVLVQDPPAKHCSHSCCRRNRRPMLFNVVNEIGPSS